MYKGLKHHSLLSLVGWTGILVVLSANGQGHPSSHVDAWARVETHLDIRVILFLDNVMALQSIHAQADNSLVPAPLAQGAMERFAETLPSLLMVFDADGRRLQGQVAELPQWQPARGGVDLKADASLRLAWKMRYPWNQAHASFSIQHRFVEHYMQPPADLSRSQDTPPVSTELRLRVRHAASGRRVDAVINSHQPHTIVLPRELSESNNQQNRTPATARFFVRPRRLVHEFTIPLVLVSEAIHLNQHELTTEIHYPKVDAAKIRKLAAACIQQNFQLLIDGHLSPPLSTFVDLLTAENEQIDNRQTVPLIGTRLGIRTTHEIRNDPLQAAVCWNNGPRHIREIQAHTLQGSNSTWQRAECRHEGPGSRTLNYECNLRHNTVLTGHRGRLTPLTLSGEAVPESDNLKFRDHRLWSEHSRVSVLHWSMWVLLIIAGFTIVVAVRRKRQTWGTTSVLTFVTVIVLVITLPRRTTEPNSETAALLLNQMLSRIYRTSLALNEQTTVDRLHEVLTDDVVETVFNQIGENAENPPFVRISDVRIANCTPRSFVGREYANFHCRWHVAGETLHWGHSRQRILPLAGTIRLETTDSKYRISDIRLEDTEPGKL